MLEIIRHYIQQGARRALILAPRSILESVWLEESERWAPDLRAICLWHQDKAERLRRLREDAHVFIVNYEQLRLLFDQIAVRGFDILVCDESSRLKDWRTQTAKAVLALSGFTLRGNQFKCDRSIPHRFMLTGTPSPNSEIEFWSQVVSCTGPGNRVFNDNPWAFRGKWFYSIDIGHTGAKLWKFRNAMKRELLDRMSPVTHVVRKSDVLPDLPPMTHQVRAVDLSTKERAAYKQLKNDLALPSAKLITVV